jgi:hypothetical protein
MTTTRKSGRNSSSVSIREAHLKRCKPDMSKDENAQTPILNLDALKVIGRLVRDFKARIESESRIIK